MQSKLSYNPVHERPYRWLPRHGEPVCVLEWISQRFVKLLAFLPVYTAIMITVVVYFWIFGVPFVGRR